MDAIVQYVVSEPEIGEALNLAAVFQNAQIRIECDLPQRDHNLKMCKDFQFAIEERTAVAQLQRRRLVVRGRAMRCRRDPRIGKLQSVAKAPALGLGGEASLVEGPVQEVAGTIAGEHTSSTISTMRTGRQPENQQPRRGIAKGWDGFTPIVPIEICTAFRDGDLATVADQARAALAFHHLPIQRDKVSLTDFTGLWMFGSKH